MAGFVAGFASVLVFHQVVIAGIGALSGLPVSPWSLKGLPMGGGGHPARIAIGLGVNGAWGLGTAALLWLALRRRRAPSPRA